MKYWSGGQLKGFTHYNSPTRSSICDSVLSTMWVGPLIRLLIHREDPVRFSPPNHWKYRMIIVYIHGSSTAFYWSKSQIPTRPAEPFWPESCHLSTIELLVFCLPRCRPWRMALRAIHSLKEIEDAVALKWSTKWRTKILDGVMFKMSYVSGLTVVSLLARFSPRINTFPNPFFTTQPFCPQACLDLDLW